MALLLDLITNLVKIPSKTGNLKAMHECIDYCKNFFNKKNVFIKETIKNNQPSVLISNVDTMNFDVLQICHIDVVPADKNMFNPTLKDGKLYGRGTQDMKVFVATGMKLLENVLNDNIDIKYGVLIVSDEETGGFDGAKYWVEDMKLRSKVVLDPDGGESINTIVKQAKGVLIVKLISKGKAAHGSKPWLGVDANENLFKVIQNLRKEIPYYSEVNCPKDTWVTTFHVAKIKGGSAMNKVADEAEAQLDFRLNDEYTRKNIEKLLEESLVDGVTYEIELEGKAVLNKEDDEYIKLYSKCIQDEIKDSEVIFINEDAASDGRYFSSKNTTVITHQSDGGGAHSEEEWVNIDSLHQLEKIQTNFLKQLSKKNK
ncbi:M20 family metallopeptidase [Pseudomonadota bacterium]